LLQLFKVNYSKWMPFDFRQKRNRVIISKYLERFKHNAKDPLGRKRKKKNLTRYWSNWYQWLFWGKRQVVIYIEDMKSLRIVGLMH